MNAQKNVTDLLNEQAMNDVYLYELLEKAQKNYGSQLFGEEPARLEDKEFADILRFADILSRSKTPINKNVALKIISVLYDEYMNNNAFKLFSKSVLTKLGLFPSISFVEEKGNDAQDLEFVIDGGIKREIQKTADGKHVLTDQQFKILNKMMNSNHFSFSAGTSFGKSFLFDEYVERMIHGANSSQNFAFLVPTRALITQVVNDLNEKVELLNRGSKDRQYKIITSPEVPLLFAKNKFIFVFTPERLVSYFSKENPVIDILIVDEAQKTISDDERSPLFYHAISLAKQKSVKLFFASPCVPNPDIFLSLVGNSAEEVSRVQDLSVTQNVFFLDFVKGKAWQYFDFISENESSYAELPLPWSGVNEVFDHFSNKGQSLVYCNSVGTTLREAECEAKRLPADKSPDRVRLAKFIRETIHEQYDLANYVEKGVAVHFGALPQLVRNRVEDAFKSGVIHSLFTTSTLLEGVNLPAKNLFVLSKKVGRSRMDQLSFRNLIGRAGRLSKELSGNVIVVRSKEDDWSEKTVSDLLTKEVCPLETAIITGDNRFYQNIGNVLLDKPLTRKKVSIKEKRQLSSYATIFAYQQNARVDSVLHTTFAKKNPDMPEVLRKVEAIDVPSSILMSAISIKPKYQQQIYVSGDRYSLPTTYDYESCSKVLHAMFDYYNWSEEEDSKKLGNRQNLPYYTVLMSEWLNSRPLNLIIQSTLNFYSKTKKKICTDYINWVEFDGSNSVHVNSVINDVMRDLENIVRFTIKTYVSNYMQLTDQASSGWGDYLNYGTNDPLIIELEKLGFERYVAIELQKKAEDAFVMSENSEIAGVTKEKLAAISFSHETEQAVSRILLG